MDFEVYSYRFAKEIIQYPTYTGVYEEIVNTIRDCPLFIYPNKTSKNRRLDVVQQLLNTYFDRRFCCDLGWDHHPNATSITDSNLAADFRKEFNGLRIQTEVQFGNMARWYTDIFKFQTAYSQDLIDIGLCIVPMASLARRMDSNIVQFERCKRELPFAKLSITLPILMIGVKIGEQTPIIDVSGSGLRNIGDIKTSITGGGKVENRYRLINGILNNTPIEQITDLYETGPIAGPLNLNDEDAD